MQRPNWARAITPELPPAVAHLPVLLAGRLVGAPPDDLMGGAARG